MKRLSTFKPVEVFLRQAFFSSTVQQEVFAELPQVSRKTFWRLRESRKCLGELFGVCGSPASASRNFLAFAGVPQVSRETFWALRESRKCHEKLFGLCRNAANASKNFLASAGMLQMPRKTFWTLQGCCKRQNGEKRPCRSSARAPREKAKGPDGMDFRQDLSR